MRKSTGRESNGAALGIVTLKAFGISRLYYVLSSATNGNMRSVRKQVTILVLQASWPILRLLRELLVDQQTISSYSH